MANMGSDACADVAAAPSSTDGTRKVMCLDHERVLLLLLLLRLLDVSVPRPTRPRASRLGFWDSGRIINIFFFSGDHGTTNVCPHKA